MPLELKLDIPVHITKSPKRENLYKLCCEKNIINCSINNVDLACSEAEIFLAHVQKCKPLPSLKLTLHRITQA